MIKVAVVEPQGFAEYLLRHNMITQSTRTILVDDLNEAKVVLVGVDGGFAPLSREELIGRVCIAYGRRTDIGFAARAILEGAQAYACMAWTPSAWHETIDAVAANAGTGFVASDDVKTLVDQGGPAGRLTSREIQIMELLVGGLTCREIGEQLGISVKTCDTHRGHILKKLELRNLADLTRFAIRYGYVNIAP